MALEINGETYLTVPETSIKSGRTKRTIYVCYKKWGWQAYGYGRNILFKQSDIQNWLTAKVRPKNIVLSASSL